MLNINQSINKTVLEWVAQTSIKLKLRLKFTWNVHEINLHLRFN
jgi:hypothetical protein